MRVSEIRNILEKRDYFDLQPIGEGGQYSVFKAEQKGLGTCVIRVFSKKVQSESDLPKIAKRELAVASRLRASNYFVKLFGYFVEEDYLFTIWEYAALGSLRDLTKEKGAFSRIEVCEILSGVAKGLDNLHALPGAHGDIKPDNLLVFDDRSVKIGDLGIARIFNSATTQFKTVMFSEGYALPSVHSVPSKNGDKFAFAVTYCELRLGRHPYGTSREERALSLLKNKPDLSGLDKDELRWIKPILKQKRGVLSKNLFQWLEPKSASHDKEFEKPKRLAMRFLVSLGMLLAVLALIVSFQHYGTRSQAVDSTAQESASQWYEKGLSLLDEEGASQNAEEAFQLVLKAAESGHADAQAKLGVMYSEGLGIEPDDAKSFHWYRKAAEQEIAYAETALGNCYLMGIGVPPNDKEAFAWFQKSASHEDPKGQFNLGVMYRDGRGVEQDYLAAVQWLGKASDQNYLLAKISLACLYQDGGNGLDKNYKKALGLYQQIVNSGCACETCAEQIAYALNQIGMHYTKGWGVESNELESRKWFFKAAEKGYLPAHVNLGIAYKKEKNYAEAIRWFTLAAEQGYGDAQLFLGEMYQVEKDYAEAIRWYEVAQEQGRPSAFLFLSQMYENGYGVVKNDAEALSLLLQSAKLGDARAQEVLGWNYEKGRLVKKDERKAVEWYSKAAVQGLASAQNKLGYMYSLGLGVEQDDAEAMKWYKKAIEQDYPQSGTDIGMIYARQKNDEKAVHWFRWAVERGNTGAMNNLGHMYATGRGVDQNDEQAFQWYFESAKKGDGVSQYNLGVWYQIGRGCKQNSIDAIKWLTLAAECDDESSNLAQNELGCIYGGVGIGVEKNIGEAIKWFTKAASKGNADSMFSLALIFEHEKQDRLKSIEWCQKAADKGHVDAKRMLKSLNF